MILLVGRLERTLDWSADHVGDIYFLVLAVIAIVGLVVGVIYAVA